MTPWEKKALWVVCLFTVLGFATQKLGFLPKDVTIHIQSPSSAWVLSSKDVSSSIEMFSSELFHSSNSQKWQETEVSNFCNINTATSSELQKLKGIGPKTAKAIVLYREKNGYFTTLKSLQNVKGIGPKKYFKIKNKIVLK